MTLNTKQLLLLEFVKLKHGEQKRKYTGEPYWKHVRDVALIVSEYEPSGVEIALCHDLFEDTPCTFTELYNQLLRFGYVREDAYLISTYTKQLTDVFTSEAHPYMNRKKRKAEEAKRLWNVSALAQTVKYADIINNTESIAEHDAGFAKVYLEEIEEILKGMRNGNAELLERCESVVRSASTPQAHTT